MSSGFEYVPFDSELGVSRAAQLGVICHSEGDCGQLRICQRAHLAVVALTTMRIRFRWVGFPYRDSPHLLRPMHNSRRDNDGRRTTQLWGAKLSGQTMAMS